MLESLLRRNSFIFIVYEHLFEQVDGLVRHAMLVARGDESLERHLLGRLDNFSDLLGQVQLIAAKIFFQVLCAHNAHNSCHLIVVVTAFEERVNIKEHAGHGAAEGPDVERIVVFSVFYEQFRSLVVSTGNANVILLIGLVEIGKAPIYHAEVALVVVDHNV